MARTRFLVVVGVIAALASFGSACGGADGGNGADGKTGDVSASIWEAEPVKDYPYLIEMFDNEAPGAAAGHFEDGELEGFNTYEYTTEPPTSGKHLAQLATPGVYSSTPVPNEVAVHNMEHGYVIIWYNCNAEPMLSPDDCTVLGDGLAAIIQPLVSANHNLVLTPHLTMEPRIALTAWQFMDALDEADEQRIVEFVDTFECHYDPENTCG